MVTAGSAGRWADWSATLGRGLPLIRTHAIRVLNGKGRTARCFPPTPNGAPSDGDKALSGGWSGESGLELVLFDRTNAAEGVRRRSRGRTPVRRAGRLPELKAPTGGPLSKRRLRSEGALALVQHPGARHPLPDAVRRCHGAALLRLGHASDQADVRRDRGSGRLSQAQLRAVGAFFSPSRGRHTAPAPSTFHYVLSAFPPDMLDRTLSAWVRQRSDGAAPVAMDGKDVRGASRQIDGERRMMVAAVEHGTGLVPGQVQVGDKTNGIPAVRELTRALGLKGRVVTLDAMHAQHETARALVEDCGADYVVTAVKDNQPTMFDDLRAIDWRGARRVDGGWEKAHGRRQAFRIERERRLVKQGAGSRETAYGLTSLGAGQAGPEELAALVRRHWHIENRLHYVRDFTYDEDRCRVRVGNLPRNLACLTNAAISIVRHAGRFAYLPPANRHYAARPQEALDAVLTPPSG